MNPLIIVVASQILFSAGDLLGRHYMQQRGFHLTTFFSLWFLAYLSIRSVATLGQLYVFTHIELGRTMALFAVVGLILANLLGYLLLGEILKPIAYVGVMLAVLAFFLVALGDL